MAEEMEHISSLELIDRLDKFMGYPRHDPHGDPIPDRNGNIKKNNLISVADLKVNDCGIISGVGEHSPAFLQYLEKLQLVIGKKIAVIEVVDYDKSVVLNMEGNNINISREVAGNLLIAL
jgi:DtxR family Mn-dependent transcriptional regulator